MTQRIAFAVPGEITRLTGGTIYDHRVIQELGKLGMDVLHIQLPASFPDPSPNEMRGALAQLAEVPSDMPLIVDGLAFGALDPEGVAELRAPLVPLVHHPLAEESGLAETRRADLYETERRNLQLASHVLVPSPHTAQLLMTRYGVHDHKITIARPGTDQPSVQAVPADPPLILSVGIQVPRKGHDVLIKALSRVQDLNWQAVIVGAPLDASFATDLARLSQSKGLSDRVCLAGKVGREELQRMYAQASLFALATRYEGYGIVFDEALANGLPIVSCATGAVRDTVPMDAGILTPPDDPDAFAAALRKMLTNSDLRHSNASAARASGQTLPGWSETAATIASALAPLYATHAS